MSKESDCLTPRNATEIIESLNALGYQVRPNEPLADTLWRVIVDLADRVDTITFPTKP